MIVNDKFRFVFVHIPKTAGTSIQTALQNLDGLNKRATRKAGGKHETPSEFFLRHGLTATSPMPSRKAETPISDYLFFCFVRNPWARFCSLHRYVRVLYASRPERALPNVPENIDDFARLLAERDPSIMKLHSIRPQTDFISQEVSFIGRYENLVADFSSVMSRLGLEIELPHENMSRFSTEDYRTLLSPSSKDIIARHYEADIRALGYEF